MTFRRVGEIKCRQCLRAAHRTMETKTYFELIEIIEGQRSIINKQASAIIDLLNQCAEQENMINVLMKEHLDE
jgi:hypothetical protein